MAQNLEDSADGSISFYLWLNHNKLQFVPRLRSSCRLFYIDGQTSQNFHFYSNLRACLWTVEPHREISVWTKSQIHDFWTLILTFGSLTGNIFNHIWTTESWRGFSLYQTFFTLILELLRAPLWALSVDISFISDSFWLVASCLFIDFQTCSDLNLWGAVRAEPGHD